MGILDHVWLGVVAVFTEAPVASIFGLPISITVVMVVLGFLGGIVVGAAPGLGGPFAMAISLPILITIFGFNPDALLPVLGFMIGIMKGATVGGAVPAILFNTPGTPDSLMTTLDGFPMTKKGEAGKALRVAHFSSASGATVGGAVPAILFNTPGTPDSLMTTLDGFPMTKKGEAGKALRVAHFSSASGDTFSDLVLFTCAPFLAIAVEAYLDFPEKAALIVLSLAFISAVVGDSVWKGLLSALFGMFVAYIGTGEDTHPRLSFGSDALAGGLPLIGVVLGVLILGEVFKALEDMWREKRATDAISVPPAGGDNRLRFRDIRRIAPFVGISAAIGTMIGALPGIGSTLAATLGYATGRKLHKGDVPFGEGTPEGVAATEAANSAVSGANLIPVLSLGIPGNVAAVFIILATETISGFNPGPAVFRLVPDQINSEMVIAFGLFTTMVLANLLNWTIGGAFMRSMGIMVRIPKQRLLPIVLLLTLTAIYVQRPEMLAIYIALFFGFVGYLLRKLNFSVLPFVIGFILANNLEEAVRQAFSATGSDPWFLFSSPISIAFMAIAALVVVFFSRGNRKPVRKA